MNPFRSINKGTNFIYKILKIIVMIFFIILTWSKVQNVFALETENYIYFSYDKADFKEYMEDRKELLETIDKKVISILKEKNIDYIITIYYSKSDTPYLYIYFTDPKEEIDSFYWEHGTDYYDSGEYYITMTGQGMLNGSRKWVRNYSYRFRLDNLDVSDSRFESAIQFFNDIENFNDYNSSSYMLGSMITRKIDGPIDVIDLSKSFVFVYDSNLPVYYKNYLSSEYTFIPGVKFYKDETLLDIKEGDQYPTYKSFNSSPGGDEEHEYILKASEHKYMVLDIDLSSSKELDFTFDLTSDRDFEIPYYKVFTENSSKIQFPNEVDPNTLKNKYTGELKGTYNTSTNKIQFIVSMNNIPTDQEITFKFKCNQEFNISYIDTSGYLDITLQKDYAVLLIPKNVNLDTGFQTDVYSPIYFDGGMTFKVQSNYNEAPTEVVFGKKYQVKEMSVVNYISKYSDKPYLYIFNENYTTQGILNLKIDTTYYNYTIFSSPYDSVDVTNPNTGGNKVETLPSTNVPSDDESFNLGNIMNDIMEYLSKATEPVRWFTMIWESLGAFQPLIYLPFLFFMILLLVNLLRR